MLSRGAPRLPGLPGLPARWARDGDLFLAARSIAEPGVWIGAIVFAAYTIWAFYLSGNGVPGADAHPMWVAGRVDHPYQAAPGELGAFLYSPAVVMLVREVAQVPWPVFLAGAMAADAAALWWLTSPLAWRWRGPLLLTLGVSSVCLTNVMPVLCVCFVLAVTRATGWGRGWPVAPLALTKITPSAAAVLWWLVRGDWRSAARAAVVTASVAAVSFAALPGLWMEWVEFLLVHQADWWVRQARVVVGAVVVVWAAMTSRWWLLGIAFYLLSPVGTYQLQMLAPLAVIPRLVEHARTAEHGVDRPGRQLETMGVQGGQQAAA
jgi:hypothetical protein